MRGRAVPWFFLKDGWEPWVWVGYRCQWGGVCVASTWRCGAVVWWRASGNARAGSRILWVAVVVPSCTLKATSSVVSWCTLGAATAALRRLFLARISLKFIPGGMTSACSCLMTSTPLVFCTPVIAVSRFCYACTSLSSLESWGWFWICVWTQLRPTQSLLRKTGRQTCADISGPKRIQCTSPFVYVLPMIFSIQAGPGPGQRSRVALEETGWNQRGQKDMCVQKRLDWRLPVAGGW